MTFNEQELVKIAKATSGIFKRSARRAVSRALKAITPKIEAAKALPDDEREAAIKALVNQATEARHRALQMGANSYSHPEWAAAAACESWLHELAGGTMEGLAAVERVIVKLRDG